MFWVLICTVHLTVCSCHVTYAFPVWPNNLLLVYKLSGSEFESSCSHLNFRFRAYFEQGVPRHSGNYRVWIHPETRTWHDKNIQKKTFSTTPKIIILNCNHLMKISLLWKFERRLWRDTSSVRWLWFSDTLQKISKFMFCEWLFLSWTYGMRSKHGYTTFV